MVPYCTRPQHRRRRLAAAIRTPVTLAALLAAGCGENGLPLWPDLFGLSGGADVATARGRVDGQDEYRVFELGPGWTGEDWRVERADVGGHKLNVALFDADWNLLLRRDLGGGDSLRLALRRDDARLKLAVSGAGNFDLRARVDGDQARPQPRGQEVLLNFAGGRGVVIHGEEPHTFPALDAADIWPDYAGQTAELEAAILATLEEHYAGFNVHFATAPGDIPAGAAYSTIHFGGAHSYLLGLADQIDRYNSDHSDAAIIYVLSFGQYVPIGLTVDDMGRFIGNVAAHELGHLLGLVHTRDPQSVMDISGGVYDLAGQRWFDADPLEPAVFPAGQEHAPLLLAETVGLRPGLDLAAVMKQQRAQSASASGSDRIMPLANLLYPPPLHACKCGSQGD